MTNENLGAARKAKQDEFYTQWPDIKREMNAYLEYDPDVFRGKTVLLPCDDPEWSNFTKFFALHFADLGLRKLISTSYAPDSNAHGAFYTPTLFETDSQVYDPDLSRLRGRVFTLTADDISGDGIVNIDDLQWRYLDGDGDFRSSEVTALRDEADFVITNPPFSLFREFLAWLVAGGQRFSIIGSRNALTYKVLFPLIRDGKVWLGKGFHGGGAYFTVPVAADASGYATGVFDATTRTVHFQNTCWFTNIDHGRRPEPLQLMTTADNLKYSRHATVRELGYQRYDNYDAIEVPFVDAIPSDYTGVMGVPITFLDKYNPDQFEVLGITQSWDDPAGLKTKQYPTQTQVTKTGARSAVGKLNDGGAIKVAEAPDSTFYEVNGEMFVKPYCRLLIRRRK